MSLEIVLDQNIELIFNYAFLSSATEYSIKKNLMDLIYLEVDI